MHSVFAHGMQDHVLMEMSALLEPVTVSKAGWKFVLVEIGVLSVMTLGILQTPWLSVDNSNMQLRVGK